MDLNNFLVVPRLDNPYFIVPEFLDVSGIVSYFSSFSNKDEILQKYEVIDDILDFYAELLGKSRNDGTNGYRIRNKQKEIPVRLESIYKYCDESPLNEEPPLKLIVEIADKDFSILEFLLGNPRKILRRDRQPVQIGRIQQIDNYCIR